MSNYYHFLTELVGKTAWLRQQGWPTVYLGGAQVDAPLLLPPGASNQTLVRELILLLSLPTLELPDSKASYRCRFNELHVPVWGDAPESERPVDEVYLPPAGQVLSLRNLFALGSSDGLSDRSHSSVHVSSALVISRLDANKRRAPWLRDLVSAVVDNVQEFPGGTMREQAHIFAKQKLVISPHGAALANVIFMSVDSALVLLPQAPWYEHYHHLASVLRSAGLLRRGLHIVTTLVATGHAGDYELTTQSCNDLLEAVISASSLHGDKHLAAKTACSMITSARPSLPKICAGGPTACLDWSLLDAFEPQHTQ
eukprot:TRINITY_DN64801_c0_g1_i1.p1 TRINITY_DN64801_c0_g1~~TRINITY_DN64801_c0_g1_i1.p1  ORF type:complete len:312 (-),score=20.00 TRINITY_DN64801_c0_g1_i1:53-988(-)